MYIQNPTYVPYIVVFKYALHYHDNINCYDIISCIAVSPLLHVSVFFCKQKGMGEFSPYNPLSIT